MKTYGEVEVQLHHSCLVLDGGEWSASCPCCFTPSTHWIGGWVGPRVSLDAVEKRKILHSRDLNQGHPAHRPSLYQLLPYMVISWKVKIAHAVHQWCKGMARSVVAIPILFQIVHCIILIHIRWMERGHKLQFQVLHLQLTMFKSYN
jgi:hypothetical protein